MVPIDSLRVAPVLDPSKYVSGATAIDAANAKLQASGKMLDVTMTQAASSVTSASDPLARLSRQYVEGYTASKRFESGIRDLSRALDAGSADANEAATVYAGMATKLGLVANGTDLARQGYTQLGAVIDTVNAKLATNATLATRAGGANDNMRGIGAAYQLQDIGVQAAMGGVNPLMIGAMQGSQLSMSFQGQSMRQAAGTMASAVTGLLNPMTLLSVGFATAMAAGIQYFVSMDDGAENLDEALKKHSDSIKGLGAAYGVALDGLDKFEQRSRGLADAQFRQSQSVLEASGREANREFIQGVGAFTRRGFRVSPGTLPWQDDLRPFGEEIEALREGMQSGKADFEEFYAALNQKVTAAPELRAVADKLILLTQEAYRAQAGIDAASNSLDKLDDAASGRLRQLHRMTLDMKAFGDNRRELASIARPEITDRQQARREYNEGLANAQTLGQSMQVAKAYEDALGRIQAEEHKAATARAASMGAVLTAFVLDTLLQPEQSQ